MRMLVAAGLVALAAGGAQAQERVVVRGPGASYPAPPPAPAVEVGRWGPKTAGRWPAGARAPGGYAAYRRPVRGFVLPSYWRAAEFYVGDWASYGLPQPPAGYDWVRYYDDAVLVDAGGAVYDTQFGVDWGRYDQPAYAAAPPPPGFPPPLAVPAQGYAVPAGGTRTLVVGPGVTTITVSSQPAVTTTTTTTEYRDEAVTYTRPAAVRRRAYRSKLLRR